VQVCPALRRIEELAYASPEWQAYNTSTWARRLSADMEKAVSGFQWANMLDCLMTTACTGEWAAGRMLGTQLSGTAHTEPSFDLPDVLELPLLLLLLLLPLLLIM
jgi:hypothetical protein